MLVCWFNHKCSFKTSVDRPLNFTLLSVPRNKLKQKPQKLHQKREVNWLGPSIALQGGITDDIAKTVQFWAGAMGLASFHKMLIHLSFDRLCSQRKHNNSMIFMLVFVNDFHFSKKWRNYASMFIIHCPSSLKTKTINNQHVDAIFGNHCNYARTKLEFWVTTACHWSLDQAPWMTWMRQ